MAIRDGEAAAAEPSFAERQLAKYGWKRGKGLGLNEDGIATHIKVRKKDDNLGIGVGSDKFGFAWWDHVYNRSANFVKVDKGDDGSVKVKCLADKPHRKTETGIISTERPSARAAAPPRPLGRGKAADDVAKATNSPSALLYSSFVKSASGLRSTRADVFDETKDYSVKISDAQLFEACGRRTARKGARGQQIGKLRRVDRAMLDAEGGGGAGDDSERERPRASPRPEEEERERKKSGSKRERSDDDADPAKVTREEKKSKNLRKKVEEKKVEKLRKEDGEKSKKQRMEEAGEKTKSKKRQKEEGEAKKSKKRRKEDGETKKSKRPREEDGETKKSEKPRQEDEKEKKAGRSPKKRVEDTVTGKAKATELTNKRKKR